MSLKNIPDDVYEGVKELYPGSGYHSPVDWVKVLNCLKQYKFEKPKWDREGKKLQKMALELEQRNEDLKNLDPSGYLGELRNENTVLRSEVNRLREKISKAKENL